MQLTVVLKAVVGCCCTVRGRQTKVCIQLAIYSAVLGQGMSELPSIKSGGRRACPGSMVGVSTNPKQLFLVYTGLGTNP